MDEQVLTGGAGVVLVATPSFDELFRAHRDDLFRALWVITKDPHEAEELAQEAFVRVFERWDRQGIEDPAAYLYRTALNLWRSRLRRSRLATARVLHLAPPMDDTALVDSRELVLRAIAPLSSMQRAVVVLSDLLDLPSTTVGELLGIRASTVRVHLARARDALRATGIGEGR